MFEIPKEELHEEFIRSSGPGGQNVNKVSTAVRLCWYVPGSAVLTEEQRNRILARLATRISQEGVLAVFCQSSRTREANRQEAVRRLQQLVAQALHVPRARRATKPTYGSIQRRLAGKKLHSERKQSRRADDWE